MLLGKNKKIILVYFYLLEYGYTPLDLAYAKAYLNKFKHNQTVEIVAVEIDEFKGDRSEIIYLVKYKKIARELLEYKAETIIFFLDNIIKTQIYSELIAINISQAIKKISKKTIIGWQSYRMMNERSRQTLSKHKSIDFIIRDEPEQCFLDLIKGVKEEKIFNLTYREKGIIHTNEDGPVIEELDKIPSPYLSGLLDEFIEKEVKAGRKSIFFSTMRGCPFKCHYCYRAVKFAKIRYFSTKRVLDELEYLRDKGIRSLVVLDDNFIVSMDYFNKLHDEYLKRFPAKDAPKLRVMLRPEVLSEPVIKKMAEINVITVQLGLQSINPKIQYLTSRPKNFDFKIYEKIAGWLKKYKIALRQIDLIFGLPGDSLSYYKKSLNFAVSLVPAQIQIKQLHFNPDTRIEQKRKQYKIIIGPARLFNVPFVRQSGSFSKADMKKAYEYTIEVIERYYPKIKFKIRSEYGKEDFF